MRKLLRKSVYVVCSIPAGTVILLAYVLDRLARYAVDFMYWLEGPDTRTVFKCVCCGNDNCRELESCSPGK